jgi:DNA gyrase/topoisomerase IV subunit B
MLERFQMMAFLNKGLEIRFKDEREGHEHEPVTYRTRAASSTSSSTSTPRRRRCSAEVGYFEQVRGRP